MRVQDRAAESVKGIRLQDDSSENDIFNTILTERRLLKSVHMTL